MEKFNAQIFNAVGFWQEDPNPHLILRVSSRSPSALMTLDRNPDSTSSPNRPVPRLRPPPDRNDRTNAPDASSEMNPALPIRACAAGRPNITPKTKAGKAMV